MRHGIAVAVGRARPARLCDRVPRCEKDIRGGNCPQRAWRMHSQCNSDGQPAHHGERTVVRKRAAYHHRQARRDTRRAASKAVARMIDEPSESEGPRNPSRIARERGSARPGSEEPGRTRDEHQRRQRASPEHAKGLLERESYDGPHCEVTRVKQRDRSVTSAKQVHRREPPYPSDQERAHHRDNHPDPRH